MPAPGGCTTARERIVVCWVSNRGGYDEENADSMSLSGLAKPLNLIGTVFMLWQFLHTFSKFT